MDSIKLNLTHTFKNIEVISHFVNLTSLILGDKFDFNSISLSELK